MNTHAKAAIVLIAIGLLAIAGYRFGWPFVQERLDRESSDARDTKAKLLVGVDNWIGYFPLCSGELRIEDHQAPSATLRSVAVRCKLPRRRILREGFRHLLLNKPRPF